MISDHKKMLAVRLHNQGLLAQEIADRLHEPFSDVIGHLRTRPGYPGKIPKQKTPRITPDGERRAMHHRSVSLPRIKCLEG